MQTKQYLNLPENLKKLRKSKNISQGNLSKMSGLSLNTIVSIETGINTNPTLDTIAKISDTLDIRIEELIHTNKRKSPTGIGLFSGCGGPENTGFAP